MMLASRGAVWTAAVVLVAAAVTGGYLGYSRAASAPGGAADTDAYDVTPLAAKQATAIAAPPPVDEDYIRKIARDEAESILHPPQAARKVAVATADDGSDDGDSSDAKPTGANPPTPPPAQAGVTAAAVGAKAPPPPPTGLY